MECVVRGARGRPVAALAIQRVALQRCLGALDLGRRDAPGGALDRDRLEREPRFVGIAEVVDVELLDTRAAVRHMHCEAQRLELADGLRTGEMLVPSERGAPPAAAERPTELAREDALAQFGRRRIGQCRDAGLHIQAG